LDGEGKETIEIKEDLLIVASGRNGYHDFLQLDAR